MMFTKYLVVVDDDVDVHNTSEVLFRLCANTDPQRDSIFTKGPADVLDPATSEIAIGAKLGIDATRKLAGFNSRGFRRFANYRARILFFCGKLDLLPHFYLVATHTKT